MARPSPCPNLIVMAASVIAVATSKGGAGKSSVTAATAGLLAQRGRVAVLELDYQRDIALDFGVLNDPGHDGGESLSKAILSGRLSGSGISARPNLDYFPGGPAIEPSSLMAVSGNPYWTGMDSKLAEAVEEIRDKYDFVLIDTPPSVRSLQHASLLAADWLLIPTPPDLGSMQALFGIASRVVEVEGANPDLKFLGVVAFRIATTATKIRSDVRANLNEILGDAVPLFDAVIRDAQATAVECRARGMLPNEMAHAAKTAEPFWKALRKGKQPQNLPASAEGLAADYSQLVDEMLQRLGKNGAL